MTAETDHRASSELCEGKPRPPARDKRCAPVAPVDCDGHVRMHVLHRRKHARAQQIAAKEFAKRADQQGRARNLDGARQLRHARDKRLWQHGRSEQFEGAESELCAEEERHLAYDHPVLCERVHGDSPHVLVEERARDEGGERPERGRACRACNRSKVGAMHQLVDDQVPPLRPKLARRRGAEERQPERGDRVEAAQVERDACEGGHPLRARP
mmetsp:Transcript_7772/g.24568  ORF Transcript_7772/g.24568 Transcript_7772/m.24568 type:complete len:213 (+) Transcript_7772:706-1344(+)